MLEGMGIDAPSGYVYIRPDNHQGYKDTVIGMTKNDPKYDFPIWDPKSVITITTLNIFTTTIIAKGLDFRMLSTEFEERFLIKKRKREAKKIKV